MKKERSTNFELLRLLCIFGILVMHTFAGIDTSASPLNTAVNVLANSLFNTGVTCFVLLSGYFGIQFNIQKLIRLDLMVIFFTFLGTIALGDFGIKSLIKSCIPVVSRQYWFISCYFVLCILAPYLNEIPKKLSKEAFRKLLLILLLVFSVIPTLTTYDIMQDAGKGLVHFVMIYLIGRYLFFYHNKTHNTNRLLLGIALSTLCVFAADAALSFRQGVIYTTFSRDCSIFIIFTAVLLLLLFREMHCTSNVINRAAGNVLAIYVLDQTIRTILNRYFDLNAYASCWYLIFIVCAYVLIVMLIAILLNEIRLATIARLEPWAIGIITSLLAKAGTCAANLSDKLLALFVTTK